MRKLPPTTDPAADADAYHVPRLLVVFIGWIAERFARDRKGVVVAPAMRSCSRAGSASRVAG